MTLILKLLRRDYLQTITQSAKLIDNLNASSESERTANNDPVTIGHFDHLQDTLLHHRNINNKIKKVYSNQLVILKHNPLVDHT